MLALALSAALALIAPPVDWTQAEVIWAHGEPFGCGHGDCTQTLRVLNGRVRLLWGGYDDIWQSQLRFGRLTPAGVTRLGAVKRLPTLPAVTDLTVPIVTLQVRSGAQTSRVQFKAKAAPPTLAQLAADMRVVERVMRGCTPHAWLVPDCARSR